MRNKKLSALCLLLSAFCYGQGFLPPQESTSTITPASQGPLLIGSKVPYSLTAADENGKRRVLLSYKSAVEIMVIGFLSSSCPEKDQRWFQLGRFYENYKDWKVAFIAVNAGMPASREELAKRLSKAGLPVPLLEDDTRTLIQNLAITSTPELVIFDEDGNLRYRGPVGKDARAALDALIGHIVPVPNAEPAEAGGCPLS